ncbi:hypothetical protein BH11PAT2_BH11PAT2_09350 [soil metagenome]
MTSNNYNRKDTHKGDSGIYGIIGLAILGLIIFGAYSAFNYAAGGEQEGVIDYSDCRQTVNLKEGDWDTHTKKFTCNLYKTTTGKIISGQCVHVELTAEGKCNTAYVYDKTPELSCNGSNQHVSEDAACVCDYGYVMKEGSCVSSDQACKASHGANSYALGSQCQCNAGYVMNGGSCISNNQDCQNTYGPESYGIPSGGNSSMCFCNSGYYMSTDIGGGGTKSCKPIYY